MTERILHIVPHLVKDGIMSFLMNYYSHIDKKQIQFDFLYAGNCDKQLELTIIQNGGKTYRIPLFALSRLAGNLLLMRKFFKEHAGEYKILHVHQMGLGYMYLLFGKLYGIPVRILHSHGTKYSDTLPKAIRNYLFTQPFKPFANRTFACGNQAGTFIFGKKKWNREGVLIHNAIVPEQYRYSAENREKFRQEFNIPQEAFVLIHVGELYLMKNPLWLLKVFAEVRKRHPETYLISCGKKTMAAEIDSLIAELGIESHVRLLGIRHDVSKILSSADVFMLPSFSEGLPVSALEAQANGLPCVLSANVPAEIKLCRAVEFCRLDQTVSEWADTVLKYKDFPKRADAHDQEFIDSGYEINAAAQKLVEIYHANIKKGASEDE